MINKLLTSDKANITVHFTGRVDTGRTDSLPSFKPGDTVSGYVAILSTENMNYKKLLVRIKWRTEGRGDTDESTWTSIEEPEGALIAGVVKTVAFSAVLPGEPWSFSGRYIAIVWGIEVEADVAWKINLRHFAPFILAPEWAQPQR
ncbi:MAG: hypothetical protein H7145_17245 [Akkermansiaceae bacterium]|nr:hypothetical protein [Armatimonadota bacterium]